MVVAMKAMKTTTAMKAMKITKAKKISKIAKGKRAKAMVLRGSKEKTIGGLTKDSLMKNKRGKVVSKRAAAHGRRAYRNVEDWIEAVMEAREALHARGFVAINGRTLQGKALYVKAKALRAAHRQGSSSGSVAPSVIHAPAAAVEATSAGAE